jgi:uncharacterized membrane protein
MARPRDRSLFRNAGIVLGFGLGGFFDGIVLHQLLQWHHMVSNVDFYSPTTLPGLQANTVADGVFHGVTYVLTVGGLALLWLAMLRGQRGTTREFVGLLLLGWGLFNIIEGIVDHLLLGVHHVNEAAPPEQWLWWDLAFLAWGIVMGAVGWWLWRDTPERSPAGA